MLTYNAILTKLAENKSTIAKYGVKRIGLFGSYLRNEQKPTSDIDILVEFEKGKITFDSQTLRQRTQPQQSCGA